MNEIDPHVYARRWWILGVLCLSLLIVFIGNSSLNIAIPTLSRELNATESQLQWAVAAYSLVFAGLLFTTGAIGDRYGRKGALQLGLVLYFVSCLLATFSHSMGQIIGARAAMGLGAAFIMPSTLSILVNVFPPEERTKAIAIWAGVVGAAASIGPLSTGFLLEHFWYGSVFLVNVPIVAAALLIGHFLLPKSRDPEQADIDPLGAVLSIIGIATLVYGLIEAPEKGWTGTATLVSFAVAAVAIVLFVVWELRAKTPMLDIRYFRNPSFSTGTGGMVIVFMSLYGTVFLFSQYLQLIIGYSPLGVAIRLAPMAIILLLVSPFTPRLAARFGANKTVAVGMVMSAVGMLTFRAAGTDTAYVQFLLSFLFINTGFALSMSPMTAAIMSAVPPRRAGAGSATNDASRELGAALGVAVMGSVAASQYANKLTDLTRGLPPAARASAESSITGAIETARSLGGAVGDRLLVGAEHAFIDGFHFAAAISATLLVLTAIVIARFMPKVVSHEGAMHSAVGALEDAAELGLAGIPPIFPDERFPNDFDDEPVGADHGGNGADGTATSDEVSPRASG